MMLIYLAVKAFHSSSHFAKYSIPAIFLVACGGCFITNIDANKEYQYVLWKGSPEKITAWTVTRGTVKEIDDGMAALQDILQGSLTALAQHQPDTATNLHLVDASIVGIVETYRLAAATADERSEPVPHYDIPVDKAGRIVRWHIEHWAYQTADGRDDIYSQKAYTLWMKLEPDKTSKYHAIWEHSREIARQKLKEIYGQ